MDALVSALRLKEIREDLGFTQTQFAEILGVKGSTADLERGKVKLPGFVVKDLYKKYQINPLWLFGETSEKFIESATLPRVIQVNQENEEQVVMVPVKASAGYALGLEGEIDQLQSLSLPWFNSQNNSYRAFQVEGASMEPHFYDGDWVVTSLVPRLADVKDNFVYVVVDQEGVRLKKLENHPDYFNLISFNSNYPVQVLQKGEVKEVWKFEMKLSAYLNQDALTDKEMLQILYKEFQELKAKL